MKSAKHQMKPYQQSNLEEPMHRSDRRMTNDPSQKVPVFIHSLFRAGSTYLFQAFRRQPEDFWCYQEPLHESVFLQRHNVDRLKNNFSEALTKGLRHPHLEKPYFFELFETWPAWKDAIDEEMIYENYFNGSHTRMDFWRVLSEAARARPVFQECRTAGRIGAIKKVIGGYHIYLWRNPWDQWWSFKVTPYFSAAVQLMIRGNHAPFAVSLLLSHLKLSIYSGKDFSGAFNYYMQRPLNSAQNYLSFYLLWCLGLQEGLESADLLLNIDRLSDSLDYRVEILKKMEGASIRGVHFDDCAIPQSFYSENEKAFFGPLEEQVHGWLIAGGWSRETLEKLLEQRRQFQPELWAKQNHPDAKDFSEQTDRARELVKRLESDLAAHANQEAELQLELSLSENRVTLLETNVKAKQQEMEASRVVRGEFEAARVEAEKTADQLKILAGKFEQHWKVGADREAELEAQKVATAKRAKELGDSLTGVRQELEAQKVATAKGAKELGDSLAGLKQELAQWGQAQQEAVERSVGEVERKIIAGIHSLIANLVEHGEKNRLAVSARIDSVKEDMEGRIVEVADYAAEIQEAVVSPSSYLIPAPFSWYSYLYKMLKIRRPNWINKRKQSVLESKRAGFWRRLELSIRKRRKRLFGRIGFDQEWYLQEYPEVRSSGIDPLDHWLRFGVEEGRWKSGRHKEKGLASGELREKRPSFFRRLEINIRKRRKRLFGRIGFDREWYLQEYPEVGLSGIEPLEHYVFIGKKEGRWRSQKQKAKYDKAYRSKLMLKLSPTSEKYFTILKQLTRNKYN